MVRRDGDARAIQDRMFAKVLFIHAQDIRRSRVSLHMIVKIEPVVVA
jgi:hypothetical protein